ncbi:uncharacterized protein LOC114301777 isoform X2 [Camellia sinensis]|uniref:uncharacterized protein LOC114301777 isoform X2 n=1 Tax=Camellia sinensis TaxID=4442 RepID=UPI001035D635|nr:uncharacterized protein LOC114301777 isoform X2 [Camellia sinensis]
MPLCGSLLINITKFSRFPLCFTLTLTLSAYGFCIRAQCLSRFWDHLSQFDQASLSLSYEWKQGKRRLKDKSLNLSIPGITDGDRVVFDTICSRRNFPRTTILTSLNRHPSPMMQRSGTSQK